MVYVLIYFFLINLRPLVGASGTGVLLKFLPNAILLYGALRYFVIGKGKLFFPKVFRESHFHSWMLFLTVFVISLLRTAYPSATAIGTFNDFVSIFLINLLVFGYVGSQVRKTGDFEKVLNATAIWIIAIPAAVILWYVIIYAIGYNHPSAMLQRGGELAVVLKLVGIKFIKKAVPYTWGMHPNTIGIFAGATFTMGAVLFYLTKQKGKTRTLVIGIILVCLAFMLVADSRGTFLMVFFGGMFSVMAYHFKMTGFLRAFVLTVPLLPFAFVSLMGVVGSSDAAAEMSRTGNADNVATMSARTLIWDECMKEVTKPKPIHLVGWGEHGESPSGVAARYAPIFGSGYPEGYTLIVTHNLFFQCFFDIGYLGIIIFLGSLLLAMNNGLFLYKRGYKVGLVFVSLILYYVLSGILESNFGNHNRSYNEVMMITVMAVIALKNEYIRLQHIYEREQEEFFL